MQLINPSPALPLTGIHMGIEEFTTLQRRLRDEARTDLAVAHGAEKTRLEDKIDALNARLADPDRALAEQQAINVSLEEKLSRQGNQLGGDATAEAKAALEAGDFTKARALFESLAAQTAPDVQTHADAAFALGQIAESDIRWHDAAGHYATAARLNPGFYTLYKAREYAWRAGDYPAAFRFGEDLLAWGRSHGTQEQLANALNAHAGTLYAQSSYPQAEALYHEALAIGRATIGTNHPGYANLLNNLAEVLRPQGRYREAEALLGEALAIDRATIGTNHPHYAIHLNNLALVVQVLGRNQEAEVLLGEALAIGHATIGTGHPDYANQLNNRAGVVRALGRYPEAEALFHEALAIDRATIGTNHPNYATDLHNLAEVLQAQGRYPEARRHYAQAVAISRDKLGDGHPNTKTGAGNYLRLLQAQFPGDPEIPALVALVAG